ncbi:hypothetical protein DBV39_15640 [Orrella marina]|uniref:Uncharacterized protein n=1 Tax=Orrella marina TaxID=2163011 RepID=A0A2R4XM94_9BURK|nr:hypothetical protein DBV39_15640 [Orrella marina]
MIERIRVSLWDIFTFFMTGLLAALVTSAFVAYAGTFSAPELASNLLLTPTKVDPVVKTESVAV